MLTHETRVTGVLPSFQNFQNKYPIFSYSFSNLFIINRIQ